MVYDILTVEEFKQRFGEYGNQKNQKRKTIQELRPFSKNKRIYGNGRENGGNTPNIIRGYYVTYI